MLGHICLWVRMGSLSEQWKKRLSDTDDDDDRM